VMDESNVRRFLCGGDFNDRYVFGLQGQVDEPHQASRFKLTRVDFPTLGSEKNPDLRPHPSVSSFLLPLFFVGCKL